MNVENRTIFEGDNFNVKMVKAVGVLCLLSFFIGDL